MKKLFILPLLFLSLTILANDGSYFVSGNQLIPINETDISVKKEILTIKQIKGTQVDITVYYEFYNPKETKEILVGFEAESPQGDAVIDPKNGNHPYIKDFTVQLNNTILPYKVAIGDDERKKINAPQQSKKSGENVDYMYIYYFTATFQKGLNIVKHTYTYDMSGSVDQAYYLPYVLTAANRWANKQIDDFTLIIDMGDYQEFLIKDLAFGNLSKWEINGVGTTSKGAFSPYEDADNRDNAATRFYIRKGSISFRQLNFHPLAELALGSAYRVYVSSNIFDAAKDKNLTFGLSVMGDPYDKAVDELSQKILRNLPFARRGYIFNTKEIQNYYSSQAWYIPDPNYKATMESLTKEEQEWIMNISKQ